MRWATYLTADSDVRDERVGLVVGDEIRGLERHVRLVDLLGDDGERLADASHRAIRSPAEVLPLAAVKLRAPIPRPPSVRDFLAFEEHFVVGLKAIAQSGGDGWYRTPVFYFTNPNAIIGPGDVVFPGQSQRMDYELEVAAVVGKAGRDLDPATAEDHIAGFCIFNDWSARDIQQDEMAIVPLGPAKGKDFANGLGPHLVTRDELEPYRKDNAFDLTMTASVNGVEYSRANLSTIYWTFGELLAYASRGTQLVPGDVIASGTCGTGCILEQAMSHGPGRYPWLEAGDEVTLEVEHLGRLVNRVRRGPAPRLLRTG